MPHVPGSGTAPVAAEETSDNELIWPLYDPAPPLPTRPFTTMVWGPLAKSLEAKVQ